MGQCVVGRDKPDYEAKKRKSKPVSETRFDKTAPDTLDPKGSEEHSSIALKKTLSPQH